jgi:nitrogen fixation protein FixH
MTAQIVPPRVGTPRGGKRPDVMLWLVGGIVAAYVATNAVMLLFALRSPPVLVSQSYYEDSRTYDAGQNAQRASAEAGWQVAAQPASTGELVVRLQDRAGRPASGFSGTVSAYRPSDAALDQGLAWSEDAATPGQYRARFARPQAGPWQIHLRLRRGGERLDHEFRVDAPQ